MGFGADLTFQNFMHTCQTLYRFLARPRFRVYLPQKLGCAYELVGFVSCLWPPVREGIVRKGPGAGALSSMNVQRVNVLEF